MNDSKRYKELGRQQARRIFPVPNAVCATCKAKPATDTHHKDGDTHNNVKDNISHMCRSCHLKADHAAGRLPKQTRLTAKQIATIKDKRTHLPTMAKKVGMTLRYLQKIRQGASKPRPHAVKYVPFVAPVGWEYKDLRGKPRALSLDQVKHILSYNPVLGTNNAEKLALKYSVAVSTIWKAHGRQDCYADVMYD